MYVMLFWIACTKTSKDLLHGQHYLSIPLLIIVALTTSLKRAFRKLFLKAWHLILWELRTQKQQLKCLFSK